MKRAPFRVWFRMPSFSPLDVVLLCLSYGVIDAMKAVEVYHWWWSPIVFTVWALLVGRWNIQGQFMPNGFGFYIAGVRVGRFGEDCKFEMDYENPFRVDK